MPNNSKRIFYYKCICVFGVLLILWDIMFLKTNLLHGSPVWRGMLAKEDSSGWLFNTTFPVDVVYTWVNGSDPRFKVAVERLKIKLRRDGSFSASKALNLAVNRFADNDALRFSLRSLEKYANWIRHVFIVTNGQIPNWLHLGNPRVTVIKHEEIFYEPGYLPTFSSHAIEHNIHKIKGLSDKFIYMNDDFFFGNDVTLADFYTDARGTKVYLEWNATMYCNRRCKSDMIQDGVCDVVCNYDHCAWDGGDCDNVPAKERPLDFNSAHIAYPGAIFYTNALYNRAFGYKPRKVIAHYPLFMDKKVKENLDRRFPKEVYETSRRKLRSPLDFQFEFSYVHFLMEGYSSSVRFETTVNSREVSFVQVTMDPTRTMRELDILLRSGKKFICLNDDLDHNKPEARVITDLVERFYVTMFPEPSSFEIRN